MTPDAFRQLTDLLSEPMLLVSGDGEVLAVNARFVQQLGVTREQVCGRSLAELVADPAEKVGEYLRECSHSSQAVPGALQMMPRGTADSTGSWHVRGAVLQPAENRRERQLLLRLLPQQIAVKQFTLLSQQVEQLAREIGRRKQTERELQQQRERLHTTLESIGDAVIVTDIEGRVTSMNPIARQLTGWGEDGIGLPLTTVFEIVNETTGHTVENPVERVLREGVVVGLANHTNLITRDRRAIPINDSAAPIRDPEGALLGVVLVFRDVLEERRAERALRRSEQQLREMADSMPQIVWTAQPDGRVDYFNRKWYENYGTVENDSHESGLEWSSLLHPDDVQLARARWQDSVASGEPYEIQYRLRNRTTKTYRWHLARGLPVRSAAGEIIRWYGTCTDIEDQKRAEQTSHFLADASVELANLLDYESTLQRVASLAVPDFADWCVVDVAGADGQLHRLAVSHIDSRKINLVCRLQERYPPRPDAPYGAQHVFRTGKSELVAEIPASVLQQIAHDDEHLRLLDELGLHSYISVPLIVRGAVFGVLTFVLAESGHAYNSRDLTVAQDLASRAAIAIDNARLYADLKIADRRKNEFLAMLAHELRNPLAPIRSGLDVLTLDDCADETTSLMMEQVEHLVRLVDDLLDVSRIMQGKIQLRSEPVELATVVQRAVELARGLIENKKHQLHLELPGEPLWIDADPVRLTQVFANLLNNAAKYTDPSGEIWLSAAKGDGEVRVTVRDNGVGIDPPLLPHVFELFTQADRSLDRAQGGLGIGLTLVQTLVRMHGGDIVVHSGGQDLGSEFIVTLPALECHPSAAPARIDQARPNIPRRILVVDDTPAAARMLGLVLEKLGDHQIEIVHDGPEALIAAERHQPEIVFLDIGLPKMDGAEVARSLRAKPEFADTLLVALTGYGQEEDHRRSKQAGFDIHLVKPATLAGISQVLSHPKLGRPQ